VKRTIPLHFRRVVESVPERTWLMAGDATFTYSDALGKVEQAASWLRAAGVGPRARVMVTARNTAEYLLSWLALMEVGATQVPVNPASTAAEMYGLVKQIAPALVVTDPSLAATLPGDVSVVNVEELFAGPADGHGPASVDERDVAVMIPTSGTTGSSKLVMQTHLAYVMAGEGFPYWLGLGADDRLMTSLPLFHINAPAYSVLGSMAARASLVLLPGFSGSTFLDSARRYQATEFNSIGAMLEIIMRQPPRPDDAENSLRLCYTGPSPTRERQLEIEARFGLEIVCGYAMSETPYGLVWRLGTRPYGTLGSPRQHPTLGHVNDARVMDDGRLVSARETGELELRNPAVMAGYFEMADETAAVIVDGWLRTGDLVTANGDGTYMFVARKRQVIRRRGENLSPTEVEVVLERHPDVAEAAVIGVPSELSEEDVKGFVVPAGRSVDFRALREFAALHLAPFKVPRYIEVVDELPHTPTGRIAKHRLPTERTDTETDLEAE
jgi:carnitine-CoA ligase